MALALTLTTFSGSAAPEKKDATIKRELVRGGGAEGAATKETPNGKVSATESDDAPLTVSLMLERKREGKAREVVAPEGQRFREGDEFAFALVASQAGRVYIVHRSASGKLVQLYPLPNEHAPVVKAGQRVVVPDPNLRDPFVIVEGKNLGPEEVHVFYSTDPTKVPDFEAYLLGGAKADKATPAETDSVLAQIFPRGLARGGGEPSAQAEATVVEATAPTTVWYSFQLQRVD